MLRYAWWNQYGTVPVAQCVERAKAARLDCLIVKAGYLEQRNTFLTAGVPVATEIYAQPESLAYQLTVLERDINAGARFAVINAEVEWETTDGTEMRRLITDLRRRCPGTPIYACTDTRRGRMQLPYQLVMSELCDAWSPMIYPKTFEQTTQRAFAAALDDKDFAGKPVIPAIQTYNNIGAQAVADQLAEVRRRRLAGYGAYTIGHATNEEWAVITADAPPSPAERLAALNKVGEIFTDCAAHGLRDQPLPPALSGAAKYLLQ